jgi:hypothetical protein
VVLHPVISEEPQFYCVDSILKSLTQTRSQAVSALIKEEQNVNKAAVILHASPAVTGVRVA